MTKQPNAVLAFDASGPALALPFCGRARGTLRLDGRELASVWRPRGQAWVGEAAPWELTVDAPVSGAWRLTLRNTSAAPARLGTVTFPHFAPEAFSPRLASEEFRELISGGSFVSVTSGVKGVGRMQGRIDFKAASNMVGVYQRDDGEALLLGVLPPLGGGLTEFAAVHSEPHLEGDFGIEARHELQCSVAPGRAVSLSPVTGLAGAPGVALLEALGDRWAQTSDRRPRRPPMVGWNSWDYAAGAVTRDFIDGNLETARRLFGDRLRVFCIDEGWEAQWGTWLPNLKFPQGLEDYVAHVKARGGIPGVWTAPLLVNTYNPLFYEHPDWFAARADGQLQTDTYAYGPMAYLDVTVPAVQEHIRALFQRLRQTGFEYFKVDFCHCLLKATRFADPSVPRNDLIRTAFRLIRDAIGPQSYLLGCGAPYESVYGSVDAVRSTGDIHTYWGHVLMNAGGIAARWWMQDRLWNCDPDFLVVRGPDTAAAPLFKRRVVAPMPPDGGWMAGREFNEAEARAYALLVHLSGGDVILGDHLGLLKPLGVDILSRVLQPRPRAVPVDLFTSDQDLPRVWISRDHESTLVGLFNWAEKPARLDFDPAAYGLAGTPRDFWTGQAVTALPERLRRRSAMALVFATGTASA